MDDNSDSCIQWTKNPSAADWMGQAMEAARQFRGARMQLHDANAKIARLSDELVTVKEENVALNKECDELGAAYNEFVQDFNAFSRKRFCAYYKSADEILVPYGCRRCRRWTNSWRGMRCQLEDIIEDVGTDGEHLDVCMKVRMTLDELGEVYNIR